MFCLALTPHRMKRDRRSLLQSRVLFVGRRIPREPRTAAAKASSNYGTEGSNLFCSIGESAANLTSVSLRDRDRSARFEFQPGGARRRVADHDIDPAERGPGAIDYATDRIGLNRGRGQQQSIAGRLLGKQLEAGGAPPAMQQSKQSFWARLQLLVRLTLNARKHAGNQPARLAHLDVATSAARIAARRRVWIISFRQQRAEDQIGITRGAPGFGKECRSVSPQG
jgi:hypothetical protein